MAALLGYEYIYIVQRLPGQIAYILLGHIEQRLPGRKTYTWRDPRVGNEMWALLKDMITFKYYMHIGITSSYFRRNR